MFYQEHSKAFYCPKCGGPWYRYEHQKMFPLKVLKHFPVTPRLQRMFFSTCLFKRLLWYSKNRSDQEGEDNIARHPCDSKVQKHFDENMDPMFKEDLWNVYFVLVVDGFNPFKQTQSTWSTLPVMLLNYDLLPWLCTKKFFIMLVLLIHGKQSVTTKSFNDYMAPLVKELLQLWEGVL